MELVVGDVDQPGAKETSPANCQHDNDVVLGQIIVIAVDILDNHFFFDIQSSKNGQTEKIILILFLLFVVLSIIKLPKEHAEENKEIRFPEKKNTIGEL